MTEELNKDRLAKRAMDPEKAFNPPEVDTEDNNYQEPEIEDPRFETRGTTRDGIDPYMTPKEGEPEEADEDTSNAENRIEAPVEPDKDQDNVVDWREKYYQSQLEAQGKELENMRKALDELKAQSPKSETSEPEPLGGRDIDDVVTDPKLFEEVISERVNAILAPMMERLEQLERGVQSVPDEVHNRVRVTQSLENQVRDWYSRNPDVDFRKATDPAGQRKLKIMMSLAEDYHSQYPDKAIPEVLDMVGDEARDLFNMKTPRPGRTSKPQHSLAGGRSASRSSGGSVTQQQPREIDQILAGVM